MTTFNAARRRLGAFARGLGRRSATLDISAPGWDALDEELNAWQHRGQVPVLWWRDDDAVAPSAALDRLLTLARSHDLPLGLAVIPATVDRSLRALVDAERRVFVLQHGWDHANHGPPGGPAAELWDDRDPEEVLAQLSAGKRRLEDLFGDRFWPVLVPPNNYLGRPLVPIAKQICRYASIFGDWNPHRLPLRNVHCDLVDWRMGGAVSSVNAVRSLVLALRLRRYRLIEAGSPIGILSHHQTHDGAVWSLLETLLERLIRHPNVLFMDIPGVFPVAHRPASGWGPGSVGTWSPAEDTR